MYVIFIINRNTIKDFRLYSNIYVDDEQIDENNDYSSSNNTKLQEEPHNDVNNNNNNNHNNNKLNINFINSQFHNDYRDVITVFNNLVPSNKQVFNIENIPLDYSEPDMNEIKGIVRSFIARVNNSLENLSSIERNPSTGWDEPLVDKSIKSGWEKHYEKLGVPTSLYRDPIGIQKVKTVAVKRIQKYEINNEAKYSCIIVLQKLSARDQLVIKVSFVIDKSVLSNENGYLEKDEIDLPVVIEEIFIEGFLSNEGYDTDRQFSLLRNKYYDLNDMEHNNILDPKDIHQNLLQNLEDKRSMRTSRHLLMNEQDYAQKSTELSPCNYISYHNTRTIVDDMTTPKIFT